MKRSVVVLVAALVGAFAVMGAAATLGVNSKKVDSFTADQAATTVPSDPAPQLVKLEMFDTGTTPNGKVDQVVATFNEPLQASSSTAGWSVSGVPSNGLLSSVSVSANGTTATVSIAEGSGSADTAVGFFSLALDATTGDIKDLSGNKASFAATPPADKAKPVPVAFSMSWVSGAGNVQGRPDRNDFQLVTFSEALVPATICAGETAPFSLNHQNNDVVTATLTDGSPERLTFSTPSCSGGLNAGSITLGAASYLTSGTATFSGTGDNSTEVALLAGQKQLRFELGTHSGSPATLNNSTLVATYLPSDKITDAATNPAAGSITFTGVQF